MVQLPRADEGANRILYRKTLFLDSSVGNRLWHLAFGGVRDAVELTINGQYVGRFFSGQVPFMVTLPARTIGPGRNTIEITALPASDESLLQHRLQWRAPARPLGVVRPVVLVSSSPVYLERLTTDEQVSGGVGVVRTTASVASIRSAAAGPVSIRTSLLLNGAVVATSEQTVTPIAERTLPVSVELRVAQPQGWSPTSPVLYQLRCELIAGGQVIDELEQDVAFRRIVVTRGEGSFLAVSIDGNDAVQSVPIKGITYVDQWLRRPDGSLRMPEYQRDVQLMQQLGVNSVYCAWNPPSQEFIALCNRAGLLVLLDLPFGVIPSVYFGDEELRIRAQNTAIRMRDAYGDHPSVAGYVLANALDYTDSQVQEYLQRVAAIVHKQQALRFVVVPAGHQISAGMPVDAVLVSDQLVANRRGDIAGALERTRASLTVPWVLMGGALVQPSNRNGYADPFSIEAQAEYLSKLYRLSSAAGSGGLVVRMFSDYWTEYPVLQTNLPHDRMCYEGVLDTARQRRVGFEMLRALFLQETEPLLQAGSFDAGTPYVFLAGGMAGIVLLFWLLNRSRRFRDYMLRAFLHVHNFFMDIRDQRILLQGQTLLLAVVIATTYALVLATLLYVTRDDPAADYLSTIMTLSPAGKALYIQLAWSPSLSLTVIELLVLVKIVVVAVVIRAVAALTSRTVLFADALTMVVWSLVPIVLFLPIAMVLFRLLGITAPLLWFGLLGAATLWGIARLLRAIAIVFEAAPLLVYLVGGSTIAIIAVGIAVIVQSQAAVVTYLRYFATVFFP
jgi:beta-galactosidase